MKTEEEVLNRTLVGEFISRFSVGDTWWMCIGKYYLEAHQITFEGEDSISKLLEEISILSVDRENVSKSTIMAANLRKPITHVRIDRSKNLTIEFEKGITMTVLTNTNYVDWQWCVNKSGKDPYQDYEIACFWEGKCEINVDNPS